MIIDSVEYLYAAVNDMKALKGMLQGNPFNKDYINVERQLDSQIKFYETILKETHCTNCMHYKSNVGMDCGPICHVNGLFPEKIKPEEYFCGAWIFDDIPF